MTKEFNVRKLAESIYNNYHLKEKIIDWSFDKIEPSLIDRKKGFENFMKTFKLKFQGNTKKGWLFKNNNVEVYTYFNPLTGERYDGRVDTYYPAEPQIDRIGEVYYMGITGEDKYVRSMVDYIKDEFNYEDESPMSREFI